MSVENYFSKTWSLKGLLCWSIISVFGSHIFYIICMMLRELTYYFNNQVNDVCRASNILNPVREMVVFYRSFPLTGEGFFDFAFTSVIGVILASFTYYLLKALVDKYYNVIIYGLLCIFFAMWVTGPLAAVILNDWCG